MSSQPITIHQFHFTATAGDAITNQMRLIQSTLKAAGIGGEIFVGENRAPAGYGLRRFDPTQMWNSDLILVHHSHANPLLAEVLGVEIPKALIYHNVTPAGFFLHDPYLARFSEDGRKQLKAFVGHVVAAFGDSRFNCAELALVGLANPTVFPLLDLSVEPERAVSATAVGRSGRQLLFVGKLTPHKNQALLIQMLYYLQKGHPDQYSLVLAGRADPLYGEYLRLLAKGLGLADRVRLTGPISQPELEKLYAESDALVCASLHEGFCVPLVEAMQRRIPIFAIPTTGVRETLGKAAVRWVTRIPYKMAESVDALLSDPAAVEAILIGQDARLTEIASIHRGDRIPTIVRALVENLRHARPVQPLESTL